MCIAYTGRPGMLCRLHCRTLQKDSGRTHVCGVHQTNVWGQMHMSSNEGMTGRKAMLK